MIERPRGTRDFTPKDMEYRNWLKNILKRKVKDYGYRETLTPTFEHTELFTERSGPSIVEEIYSFEDKGGREIALRPEFTASVMRMYSESLKGEPKPIKLFYFGPAFRYERPQSGRYREFWHFGTELIGADTARADAENIALAYDCMREAGLENIEMRISNLQILEEFLKERDFDRREREEIYHQIDKEDDLEVVKDRFDLDESFLRLFSNSFDELKDFLGKTDSYAYLKDVIEKLRYYDIKENDFGIDLSIVRGLDYYSGVVFEIEAESLGAQKQICGGGDYDLSDVFNIDVSSKGFAIGFDRMLLALKKEDKLPSKDREGCYVIPLGEENHEYSYEILSMVRDDHRRADIDLKGRGIGKSLGYADKAGFEYSLIIGEDEVKNDVVALKDMESGEQEKIPKNELKGAL
ncbi:MAG: histidine--tRNA ligase [Candidatus Natronoplasma sp.]